ncbi:MAG: hypothetical protein AAGI63_15110, partial [Planctomycetota bacterium]
MFLRLILATVLFCIGVSFVDAGLITSSDVMDSVCSDSIDSLSHQYPIQSDEVVIYRGEESNSGLAGTGA